jgi:hypothetical protein
MTEREATMRGVERNCGVMARRPKRPADRITEALLALTIRTLRRIDELEPPRRRAARGRGCEPGRDTVTEPSW